MARRSQATCKSDSTSPKLNLRLPVRIARRRRLTLSGERMARGPAGHSDCLEPVRVPADGSDGLAQTTFRRDDGMNPDSPGDERHRAGLLRSRRISVPFPWGSRRSCGQLRLRSPRRSLGNTLRMEASESKPGNPGFYPDPGAALIASCGPALAASEVGPAATAHSGVMAHVS